MTTWYLVPCYQAVASCFTSCEDSLGISLHLVKRKPPSGQLSFDFEEALPLSRGIRMTTVVFSEISSTTFASWKWSIFDVAFREWSIWEVVLATSHWLTLKKNWRKIWSSIEGETFVKHFDPFCVTRLRQTGWHLHTCHCWHAMPMRCQDPEKLPEFQHVSTCFKLQIRRSSMKFTSSLHLSRFVKYQVQWKSNELIQTKSRDAQHRATTATSCLRSRISAISSSTRVFKGPVACIATCMD